MVREDSETEVRLSPETGPGTLALVVTLSVTAAGSDWLREDTPFSDWTVKTLLHISLLTFQIR